MDSTSMDVYVQPARGEDQQDDHDHVDGSGTQNEPKSSLDVGTFKVHHHKPELAEASLRWVSIFYHRHLGPMWNDGELEQQSRRQRRYLTLVGLIGPCLLLLLLIGHAPPREVDKERGRISRLASVLPSRQAKRRRLIEMNANETLGVQVEEAERMETHDDRGVSTSGEKRLLYIITSSKDRFEEVVIPIILDAVESFVQSNEYSVVDVYMIVSYTFSQKKMNTITSLLPPGVGFQVWEDAMPMFYSCRKGAQEDIECLGGEGKKYVPADQGKLQVGGAQLARQHRYVVKDKLPYYDFFVVFEDVRTFFNLVLYHFISVGYEKHYRLDAFFPNFLLTCPALHDLSLCFALAKS
jgi:hypothetical protein